MKVAISVHGRFHAFDLASELQSRGNLRRLLTTYPRVIAAGFLPRGTPVTSAPWIELARRCRCCLGRWGADHVLAAAFGRFAARNLPPDADLLVGWSGASLEAIQPARDLGMKVVIERGSTHIRAQTALLEEEFARFDIEHRPTHPHMIEREVAEYELADAIVVPTSFAAHTFINHGIPREKIIVNPYGLAIDLPSSRSHSTGRKTPTILFVGSVGLRKGIPYLLEAFSRLAGKARLHVVGPHEPAMERVVGRYRLEGVTFFGPLRGSALDDAYQRADIFCMPSLEEGLPLALIRAIASGLPVVATPECGLDDVFTDAEGGLSVPARDAHALEAALGTLISDPERRTRMGYAALRRAREHFTRSAYGTRAHLAYEGLLRRSGKEKPTFR